MIYGPEVGGKRGGAGDEGVDEGLVVYGSVRVSTRRGYTIVRVLVLHHVAYGHLGGVAMREHVKYL